MSFHDGHDGKLEDYSAARSPKGLLAGWTSLGLGVPIFGTYLRGAEC